jgi:uncharacterized protein
MMTLAPFVHAFDIKEDMVCLYNSLTLKKIFLKKTEYELLIKNLKANNRNKITDLLENAGFILNKKLDYEALMVRYAKAILPARINIANFFVVLTDQCNYDCKYCYIERPLRKNCSENKAMSLDTAKLVLKSVLNNSDVSTKAKLNFYGGEPLLNKEIMLFLLKEVTQKRPNIRPQIVTNGSLVTEEIAEILKKYNVFTTVSLDGWEELNNKARVFIDGRPTFEDTMRGIKILQKHGVLDAISCTVSVHNYNRLVEVIEFFKDMGIRNVGMNYLIRDTLSGSTLDPEVVAENMFDAFLRANEIGIFEGTIGDKRAKHLWLEKPRRTDCTGCGTQIYYSPKGLMGPCQAFHWSKDEQVPIDPDLKASNHPLWQKWAKRTPYSLKECFNCEALGVCGGGCPYNSYVLYGDMNKLDDDYCKFMKRIMRRLLQYYYDAEIKNKTGFGIQQGPSASQDSLC